MKVPVVGAAHVNLPIFRNPHGIFFQVRPEEVVKIPDHVPVDAKRYYADLQTHKY
jgi:hypothetical protein